jgi:hypothetical protein
MKTKFSLTLLLTLSLTPFVLSANQSIVPQDACNYLKEERFRGNLEYRKNKNSDSFSCGSLRKPIDKGEPTTSDLRYSVSGSESSVTQISLLLRMNSFKISTPVLKEFSRVSNVIYLKALNKNLPEEIEKSILSAIRGEWQYDGYSVKLIRKHDKARVYELEFMIEINQQ